MMSFLAIASVALLMVRDVPADDVATPWQQPYAGTDATGPDVLGLWKFDDAKGLDATGKQPQGQLRNGKFAADGRFGGALESFAGFPETDRSHGFVIPHNPRLTLAGSFTIEMWIKPKPAFADRTWSIVLDKKYAGNDDYQLGFTAPDAKQERRLNLSLGFGAASQNFLSDSGMFPADQWAHIAVTYDGKGGVRFFRNGASFGGVAVPGLGAVSAGTLALSIGDRLGSNYPGFPGFLDEVRISRGIREFSSLRITTKWPRRTFVRFEHSPQWTTTVTNLLREPITGATLDVTIGESAPVRTVLPELAPGKSHDVELSFDTQLRPDTYTIELAAAINDQRVAEKLDVTLVPRPLPDRMPVVMWGIGGIESVVTELPRLKQLGFTHCFGGEVDHSRIVPTQEPTAVVRPERLDAATEMLDQALANDLRVLATTTPRYFESQLEKYLQTGRDGAELPRRTLTPNAPSVMSLMERTGASIAQTYGNHPGFAGICVNSEVRDDSQVSFTPWDLDAYRQAFGANASPPAWVKSKYPPSYTTLAGFPANRVVPHDHPQLAFYRWWWERGDGWNAAHSAVHHGMHRESSRSDLWTFTDPVVRCPPLWGSGGDVDVLSQWTYTDPDPVRMALPVDELLAMADGREPPARVMKMTQLFWYRSTTAPANTSPREGTNPATWVDQDPNTSFISIHPIHLREAFWTKIARPIEGIMYHGWSSLVPTDGSHAYKYTHPQLQHELRRLISDVVEPLGPTLRQVPAAPSDIAFLESFTTFAFTARSTWGYAGGWSADAYFALQYARLQPEVIYEQHVLRDGLDRFKLLVMADCEVLTRDVVDKVLAFQERGGLVIGDERLCPAIKADIVLPILQRTKDAAADKARLLELAETIRQAVAGKYSRVVDTSSANLIPHRRRAGASDYLFLVNDAREAGDYVGQYGRVHELGLPTVGTVRLTTPAAALYDLVRHRPVPFQRDRSDLVVPVTLGPGDGCVWLTTPKPIAAVAVTGPEQAARSQSWSGQVAVTDVDGQPIDAVIPLKVEILDADGRLAERSGCYGAVGGKLNLTLDLAANDQPGMWEIRATELASGQRSSLFMRVGK